MNVRDVERDRTIGNVGDISPWSDADGVLVQTYFGGHSCPLVAGVANANRTILQNIRCL